MNVFTTQYRFDDRYGDFKVASPRPSDAGYFRFGENAICYGRTSAGFLRPDPGDVLYDVLHDITIAGCNTALPFDADEIIDNLRYLECLRLPSLRRRSNVKSIHHDIGIRCCGVLSASHLDCEVVSSG